MGYGVWANCIRQHHGVKAGTETVSGNRTVWANCIRQHRFITKLFAMFGRLRHIERWIQLFDDSIQYFCSARMRGLLFRTTIMIVFYSCFTRCAGS